MEKPLTALALPFVYFSAEVPKKASPEQLHQIYIDLHGRACQLVKNSAAASSSTSTSPQSPISYNLGFTDRAIVLCPRTSEGLEIEDSTGKTIGPIALNGTVLGGTLLVKSEEEWNALRNDDSKLASVLQAIGISSTVEQGGRL